MTAASRPPGPRVLPLAAIVFGLVLLFDPSPALAQCSMCRAVITQSAEGQRMAGELNRAILLMVAAPYLIFGSCAAVLFRSRLAATLKRVARILILPR
jgi:hypothetical protein